MAPPLVVPHVVRMAYQGAILDDRWACVLDVEVTNNASPGTVPRADQIDQATDRLWDAWGEFMAPLLSDKMQLDQIAWTDLDSATGGTGVKIGTTSYPAPVKGLAEGQTTASGIAVLVNKTTDISRRGVRSGRMFLPGLTEQLTDGNFINTGDFGTFQTYINNFLAGATETGALMSVWNVPVVVHRPKVGAAYSNQITAMSPRQRLSHQIRRMDR